MGHKVLEYFRKISLYLQDSWQQVTSMVSPEVEKVKVEIMIIHDLKNLQEIL